MQCFFDNDTASNKTETANHQNTDV